MSTKRTTTGPSDALRAFGEAWRAPAPRTLPPGFAAAAHTFALVLREANTRIERAGRRPEDLRSGGQ